MKIYVKTFKSFLRSFRALYTLDQDGVLGYRGEALQEDLPLQSGHYLVIKGGRLRAP